MKFGKHCGLVKSFDELRFKIWLDNNAYKLLESLKVKPGQTILDFGCGKGDIWREAVVELSKYVETDIIHAHFRTTCTD